MSSSNPSQARPSMKTCPIPGVMRRFLPVLGDDERLVGITVHDVKKRLPSDLSDSEALRKLTRSLIERLNL